MFTSFISHSHSKKVDSERLEILKCYSNELQSVSDRLFIQATISVANMTLDGYYITQRCDLIVTEYEQETSLPTSVNMCSINISI